MNILGIKISVELIILCIVIYLVMAVHTVCGCSKVGLTEALETMSGSEKKPSAGVKNVTKNTAPLPVIKKEGFVGSIKSTIYPSNYKLGDYSTVDTSSWVQPSLVVNSGEISSGVRNILDRQSQTAPLPEDSMSMFANTKFKPECCPNTYSNSSGCACMTSDQVNTLKLRGNNNIPYSEY
jgi:hypothetical protein